MLPDSQTWVSPPSCRALLKLNLPAHLPAAPAAGPGMGGCGNQPAEDLADPGEPHHPNIAWVHPLRYRFGGFSTSWGRSMRRCQPGPVLQDPVRAVCPRRSVSDHASNLGMVWNCNGAAVCLQIDTQKRWNIAFFYPFPLKRKREQELKFLGKKFLEVILPAGPWFLYTW